MYVAAEAEVLDGLSLLLKGLLYGHVSRQRLVLHLDELRRPLRCVFVDGCHRNHGVAHVPYFLGAEGLLVLADGQNAVLLRQVDSGDDCHNARDCCSLGRVDGLDAGVGQRAPQELGVEHARQADIVGELRLSGDLRGAIDPGSRLPYDGELTQGPSPRACRHYHRPSVSSCQPPAPQPRRFSDSLCSDTGSR